jgi:phosphoribosylaminoimidazole synthetase
VGVVERKNILKKENIKENSILIGLESNGFHSNGYSLIRKIIKEKKVSLKTKTPYKSSKHTLGEDLIEPTKIYVRYVLPLIKKKKISAIAHITGGGIFENLERIVPKNFFAEINTERFSIPEKFLWLKEVGQINSIEMLKTFNCGIGLILAIDTNESKKIMDFFKKKGINSYIIGKISKNKKKQQTVFIKKFGQWDLI